MRHETMTQRPRMFRALHEKLLGYIPSRTAPVFEGKKNRKFVVKIKATSRVLSLDRDFIQYQALITLGAPQT